MGNLLTAKVEIEGTRTMLWNWFGPDAIPLEKQERTGVAGNDPEEWKRTVLKTSEGQLYVEPSYVFGCFKEGAVHTKKGRGSIQSLVVATLQVMDERILVDRFLLDEPQRDPTLPVYLDVRMVVNPTTKARNIRYRIAAGPGWKMGFRILWDKTVVDRHQMQAVIRDAGKLVGIGNGRKIGFGRFDVLTCDIADA